MGIFAAMRAMWVRKETWPPAEVRDHWRQIDQYRMRYRNDRAELIRANPNLSTDVAEVARFTPVPWPRELCRFSAGLLFSETPRVAFTKDEAVLEGIMEVNDFGAFAVRGGIMAAGEGICGIRVILDDAISTDTPLITLVPEDQIIWDRRHGSFYVGGMVIITRKPDPDNTDVYRLMEEHTSGLVTRNLYKGKDSYLGKLVPLDSLPEFATLAEEFETGIDKPTLIPWENVPGGESDMFGLFSLFDEINEAESLLVDRGRKSIPRLFVDKSLADETGRVQIDGVILTGGSRMRAPLGAPTSESINVVDVKLQFEQHVAWIDHINQLLVTCAGYAPSTWGIQGQTASVQRAVSGYAMKLAQLRTLLNRSAKEHMALEALGWAVATAIALASKTAKVSDCLPSIELGDGLPNSPLDGAQEVLFLRQAMAASTEELVKIVNPTWTPDEVAAEVAAIEAEGMFPPGAGTATGIGPASRRTAAILSGSGPKAGDGIDDGATDV